MVGPESGHRVTPGSRPLVMGFCDERTGNKKKERGGSVVDGDKSQGVPVTVLTGFLGSGKTTLLNRILTANHGKRIAVIQNEFGEDLGLGSTLAAEGKGAEIFEECYEMNNGCICCSVRDDLVNTLERIMSKRDKFDYVLVETTGMANPGPIASIFWLDEELGSDLFLDAIVTLVDAKHITYHLDDPSCTEAAQQIAYADRILLNKKDLVTPSDLDSLEDRVQSINSMAPIFRTQTSDLDLDLILGIRAFDPSRAMEVEKLSSAQELPADAHCSACAHGGDPHEHEHNNKRTSHDVSVGTLAVELDGDVDLPSINRWLGGLLWEGEGTENYFRIKGVLSVKGDEHRVTLQGVHTLFETQQSAKWEPSQKRYSKIVFIGRSLDKMLLQAGFERCAAA